MHMDTNFTAKEKILLHLLDYYGKNEGYALPVAITQEGIAEKVGLKQNTVSYGVRNLVKDGFVDEETRRIRNKKQKRKAYFLTGKGVDKAEKIRNKVAETKIKVDLNGEEKEIRIGELNAFLNTNLSYTEILKKVEHEGKIEQKKVEGYQSLTSYYYHMPEPPHTSVSQVDELLEWYEKGSKIAGVVGEDGSGKTTVLSKFAKQVEGKTNIFYLKVKEWQDEMYFWTHIARFLEGTGQYRFSSYLHAPDRLDDKEIMTNLRKDFNSSPSILLIDDVHLNDEIKRIVKQLITSDDPPPVRIVLSKDESTDEHQVPLFEKAHIIRLKSSMKLHDRIKDFYGVSEQRNPITPVLKNHLTTEEFRILAFLSILRKPIRKKELYRLYAVNENIVKNLLVSPLLDVTVENKPIIHPIVSDIIKRLPTEKEIQELHKIAYQSYLKNPLSDELDRLEEIHHISRAKQFGLFEKRIQELGEDILSSGFGNLLLKSIEYYKNELRSKGDTTKNPYFINFLEGEAYRQKGKIDSALEKYDEVLQSAEDTEIVIQSHHGRASIKEREGQAEEAIKEYYEAINILLEKDLVQGEKELLGISRIRLGSLLNDRGDYDEARKNLNRAIDTLEENNHSLLTTAHFILARIEKSDGNWKKAVEHFERGLKYWEEIDETYQRIGGLKEIGALYTIMRELDDAEEHLREAVQTSEKFGYWQLKASALLSLSECYLERRIFDKAIEHAEKAKDLFEELGSDEEKAQAHSLLGKAYMFDSQDDNAEKELTKAISIYQRLGLSYRLGLTYFSLAKLKERIGNKQGVAKNYRKAILSFSGSGDNWMAEKVEREMDNIPISM